jgi:hypothetical protein
MPKNTRNPNIRTTSQNSRNRQGATKGPGRVHHAPTPPPPPPSWYRRPWIVVSAAAVVLVAVVIGVVAATSSSPTTNAGGTMVSGPPGPEGVPLEQGTLLASIATAAAGRTVDQVQCNTNEQVAYHVHTHLSVYVDGQLRPIPAGIGIVAPVAQPTAQGPFDEASHCYYWLHVHAQDGVIHIESPAGHSYVLGQFFDIWGQTLSAHQVGPARGTVTAFLNGRRYRGDPRTIPLGSHEDVQLDVGTPVVTPKSVNWSVTSL